MKKILLFLAFLPFALFGQNQNVRHVITPDGEITFWRGTQQLFVRAYEGEPIYVADYYVAVNGNDANPGTFESPFATWQKALEHLNLLNKIKDNEKNEINYRIFICDFDCLLSTARSDI